MNKLTITDGMLIATQDGMKYQIYAEDSIKHIAFDGKNYVMVPVAGNSAVTAKGSSTASHDTFYQNSDSSCRYSNRFSSRPSC